jgi:CRISPR-associated protein Csc1
VVETAPLLHNYALAYACGLARSPYYHEKQAPNYDHHLREVNQQGIYLYPAIAKDFQHCLMQYNTTTEMFSMAREKSLGFPNWGYIKCIQPGSVFETYLLSANEIDIPHRIRLGKWMSQASISISKVSLNKTKQRYSSHLINAADLVSTPHNYGSLYNMLPTRLVSGPSWEAPVDGYSLQNEDGSSLFLPASTFARRIQR